MPYRTVKGIKYWKVLLLMLWIGPDFKWLVLEVRPTADTTKHIMGLRGSRPIIHNTGLNVWFFPPCGCHNFLQRSECWKSVPVQVSFRFGIKTQALRTTERVGYKSLGLIHLFWASFAFSWARIKLQRYIFILFSQFRKTTETKLLYFSYS